MFLENKFWRNKIEIDYGYKINEEVSLCWLWRGALDKDGYGVTTVEGKYARVHVQAIRLTNPSFDPSKLTLHKCNIKGCYRPEHLYQGNHSQNAKDSVNAGTHIRARRTHCIRGHEFTQTNTRFHTSKKGKFQRICLECEKIRNDSR